MGNVCLITGIPGAGKTTIVDYIKTQYNVNIVRYGMVLFNRVKERFPDLTYEEFKGNAKKLLVTSDRIFADQEVIREVNRARVSEDVLIESHGVNYDEFGIRIDPYKDISELRSISLSAIIFVYTAPANISCRVAKKTEGREAFSLDQLKSISSLQQQLSITYAVISGCPMWVIDNNYDFENTKLRIRSLFDNIFKDI